MARSDSFVLSGGLNGARLGRFGDGCGQVIRAAAQRLDRSLGL